MSFSSAPARLTRDETQITSSISENEDLPANLEPVISESPESLNAGTPAGNTSAGSIQPSSGTIPRPIPLDSLESFAITESSSFTIPSFVAQAPSPPRPVDPETFRPPRSSPDSSSSDDIASPRTSNVSSEQIFPFSPQSTTPDLPTPSESLSTPALLSPRIWTAANTPLTSPVEAPSLDNSVLMPTLAYPVTAYHLPAVGTSNGVKRVNLSVTLSTDCWFISLSPPFQPSKREHTVLTVPGTTLKVSPHPVCSCGHAQQEQKRHQEKLKEKAVAGKARSRAGSGAGETAPGPGAQTTEEGSSSWDPFSACTAACRLRRDGGKISNPWRSKASLGQIDVEYWLYIDHLLDDDPLTPALTSDSGSDDETLFGIKEDELPLLTTPGWSGLDYPVTIPMWKRGLLLVRIEDRLPVDMNEKGTPERDGGEFDELRVLETWFKKRFRITGHEAGWAGRFSLEEEVR